MNIYIPIWENDPHNSPNPYVSTLTDELKRTHDVSFYFGIDLLWDQECENMDIVHIMWPDFFSFAMEKGRDLKARLLELKTKGVRIVSTCHNLHAHIQNNKYSNDAYSICYEHSDIIIHLGEYSHQLISNIYSAAQHIVIPHHVYNKLYGECPTRNDSIKYLGLKDKYRYILCMGKFRTIDEMNLVKNIAAQLRKKGVRILAPTMFNKPIGHKNPLTWWRYYANIAVCRTKGIIANGIHVKDVDLPFYYGASDLSFIQRIEILNSGNVPLGMFMSNVIVGPAIGNVGEILKKTGNPTFIPENNSSIINAIEEGLMLQEKGHGIRNRSYCINYCTTEKIANRHWTVYNSLTDYE